MQGNNSLVLAYERLGGISILDLAHLSPEELMRKIGSSSLDAASMVEVMGKNATELRPTLEGVADGTIKFSAAIDEIDIKKLADADDIFKSIFNRLKVASAQGLVAIWEGIKTMAQVDIGADAGGVGKPLGPTLEEMGASPVNTGRQVAKEPTGPGTAVDNAEKTLQKLQDTTRVMELQNSKQSVYTKGVKDELDYRTKIAAIDQDIQKASDAGHSQQLAVLEATRAQLVAEEQITLQMNAQAIATKNLETMKSTLAQLSAIPEGADAISAGYSPGMEYAGHQARQAQAANDQADYLAKYKGDFEGASMYRSRAADIEDNIDPLKDSEKDMTGQIRAGVDASRIATKIDEIADNTAQPLMFR